MFRPGPLTSPLDYHQWAMQLDDRTPLAETAKALCSIRMQHPYDYVPGLFGMIHRWQAVALEAAMLAAIGAVAGT